MNTAPNHVLARVVNSITAIVVALGFVSVPAWANEENSNNEVETLVITATKRESTLQETGLAVSAIDGDGLEEANIDHVLDLQLHVPNLLFTKGNFTGANLVIRGIGNNAVAASSDGGVGVHFNGAYQVAPTTFEAEFYDINRVEVLRGPQGTLYGRNTTGGVLNVLTNEPSGDLEGGVDLDFGSYSARKVSTYLNIPVIPGFFQMRIAGYQHKRDGIVTNELSGNLIDDRDLQSFRFSGRFGAEDSAFKIVITHESFDEEDKRLRGSKQLCHTDTSNYPFNLGCLPGRSLYSDDATSASAYWATLAGFLGAAVIGQLPFPTGAPGAPNPLDLVANDGNPDNFRSVSASVDPYYNREASIDTFVLDTELFAGMSLNVTASKQKNHLDTNNDYNGTVNPDAVRFTTGIPLPTLAGAGAAAAGADAATVAAVTGYASDPVLTGNGETLNDRNYLAAFDYSGSRGRTETSEARIFSNWSGVLNFMAGVFDLEYVGRNAYEVHSNTLALAAGTNVGLCAAAQAAGTLPVDAVEEVGGAFDCAKLGYYRNDTHRYLLNSEGQFFELYFDWDAIKFSFGTRTTDEDKTVYSRQTLLNDPTTVYREGLSGRAYLNNASNWTAGWTTSGTSTVAPIGRQYGSWSEPSTKAAVDWKWSEDILVYAVVSESYKSGGLNPPSFTGAFAQTFGPEFINATEFGIKINLDSRGSFVNVTYFDYDFQDMQISKIVDRTAVNENIDAVNSGIELEVAAVFNKWRIDFTASMLDTEIVGGSSINSADPANAAAWAAAGNTPDFVNVKNGDTSIFVVPSGTQAAFWNGEGTRPANTDATTYYTCGDAVHGGTLECTTLFLSNPLADTATVTQNADGVWVSDVDTTVAPIGVAVDLTGNQLPSSPEASANLSVTYFTDFVDGKFAFSIDSYWQDEFYYRVYNTEQDKIREWSIVNISASYSDHEGRWGVRAYVKNVRDDDYITGAYFTDASSGNFTNVFLLDPREAGVSFSLRY